MSLDARIQRLVEESTALLSCNHVSVRTSWATGMTYALASESSRHTRSIHTADLAFAV